MLVNKMAKKYDMVYRDLLEQINRGELTAGAKLPSENELVERYEVSRQTIRQALKLLEDDGCVSKVRGSGSFVQKTLTKIDSNCVAVITYDIAASVFPAVLSKIEQTLFNSGYSTMLFSTLGSPARERQILQQLCANPVNGIILYATESAFNSLNLDLILKLQGMGTRFVFMDNRYPDEALRQIPCVSMDDYESAYQVTAELISSGAKSIGGIFTCMAYQLLHRFLGVRKAMTDLGMDYDRRNFLMCDDNSEESVRQHIEAQLPGLLDKEAVICASGVYAALLSDCIRRHGSGNIKTMVSFDDVDLPSMEGIRVIKLKHAGEKIGVTCAQKIVNLIQGSPECDECFPWETNEGKQYPA